MIAVYLEVRGCNDSVIDATSISCFLSIESLETAEQLHFVNPYDPSHNMFDIIVTVANAHMVLCRFGFGHLIQIPGSFVRVCSFSCLSV